MPEMCTARPSLLAESHQRRQLLQLCHITRPLEKMKTWLDETIVKIIPNSLTGKALNYMGTHWKKLIRFTEDGRLNIDNNPVEQAIRPFVVGRKNWLFSDTPEGAHANANLYSLIETAKANNKEPYEYLCWLFKKLPSAKSLEDFESLLPWNS